MVKDVVLIDENASVKKSAEVMNEHEISSVIATRNGKPIGILTERDLLKRIVAQGKNAKRAKVKDIMSSPLTAITPDTHLEEAARIMFDNKIKKLPIIEQGRLIGMLSLTDIARCQPHLMLVLKGLLALHETSKSMKKAIDVYVV
jgi:CBS domain-containing protein